MQRVIQVIFILSVCLGLFPAVLAGQLQTTRVSVDSAGSQGDGPSGHSVISRDGRYVAFESNSTNLVSGDTNGREDVFVHDRQTGETTRVGVDSNGSQGNNGSDYPSISGDGRYVAFVSDSTNLVNEDMNGTTDIFIHDRQTGETTWVSVDSEGAQGNDWSYSPAISGDGRSVAFHSPASNLVSGDTNGMEDVFVHDRETGETTRVSVDSAGGQGDNGSRYPAISSDGRYVAFQSFSSNLVSGDTNGMEDVFVHDRQTGETTRVSVDSAGGQGDNGSRYPAISSDGRYVAFESDSTNLVSGDTNGREDVFVHDRQTGETTRVSVDSAGSQGNLESYSAAISGDGRYVAFQSYSPNLVSGDTNGTSDVFFHDRQTGETTRVSVDSVGSQDYGGSHSPSISGDGRYVSFQSNSTNLVNADTNDTIDVFVRGPFSSFTWPIFLPAIIRNKGP